MNKYCAGLFLVGISSAMMGMESTERKPTTSDLASLVRAIKRYDLVTVQQFLKKDPGLVQLCDSSGDTSIHVAVEAYSAAHIDNELFLSDDEAGDLERRSDRKRGAQEGILKALLESGADPNACDRAGDTPLDRLTKGTPLMLSVGTTNFRAVTPAHLLFYDRGAKTSEELKKERQALLKEPKKQQSGKRKRGK